MRKTKPWFLVFIALAIVCVAAPANAADTSGVLVKSSGPPESYSHVRYGLTDLSGKEFLPCVYTGMDRVPFYEGDQRSNLAKVVDVLPAEKSPLGLAKSACAVYADGRFLTEFVYSDVSWVHQGMILCVKDIPPYTDMPVHGAHNYSVLLTLDGRELVSSVGYAYPFRDGVYFYNEEEGTATIFGKDGKVLATVEDCDPQPFYEHIYTSGTDDPDPLFPIVRKDRFGFVNIRGELVIPCSYRTSQGFFGGYAVVSDTVDGQRYFIDKKGNRAFTETLTDRDSVGEGFIGEYAILRRYPYPNDYGSSHAAVTVFMDKNGQIVSDLKDTDGGTFKSGEILADSNAVVNLIREQRVWTKSGYWVATTDNDEYTQVVSENRVLVVENKLDDNTRLWSNNARLLDAGGNVLKRFDKRVYRDYRFSGYLFRNNSGYFRIPILDLLDMDGNVLVSDLAAVDDMNGDFAMVRRGFSCGVMNIRTGEWVSKQSIFTYLDD